MSLKIKYTARYVVEAPREVDLEEVKNIYGFDPNGLSVDEILAKMKDVGDEGHAESMMFSLEDSADTTLHVDYVEDTKGGYFPRTTIGHDSLGNPVSALFDGKHLGIYRAVMNDGRVSHQDVIELEEGNESELRRLLNLKRDTE